MNSPWQVYWRYSATPLTSDSGYLNYDEMYGRYELSMNLEVMGNAVGGKQRGIGLGDLSRRSARERRYCREKWYKYWEKETWRYGLIRGQGVCGNMVFFHSFGLFCYLQSIPFPYRLIDSNLLLSDMCSILGKFKCNRTQNTYIVIAILMLYRFFIGQPIMYVCKAIGNLGGRTYEQMYTQFYGWT
jgi:hypothetical protein